MYVKDSVAQADWQDKYMPGDESKGDLRWVNLEDTEGFFMWVWQPATIEYLNGLFVAQVGARIEHCPTLEGAEWWCETVMDVPPVISLAAELASRTERAVA